MAASAAIADSLLRRAFGWQARRSPPRRTVQVRLGISRLRMPVSQRDFAISRRTVMNNAGWSKIDISEQPQRLIKKSTGCRRLLCGRSEQVSLSQ